MFSPLQNRQAPYPRREMPQILGQRAARHDSLAQAAVHKPRIAGAKMPAWPKWRNWTGVWWWTQSILVALAPFIRR
jgi:hypothetical protein